MKKVLFLMFLLFLCLGTADVNAQVRIGGNAAPNGAAVLDLNATDAATGTKGLALPRVRLDSTTMQITTGVANLAGMLVWNTSASSLGQGIYFWNGSSWVKGNLPVTTMADSGFFLMSNGSSWVRGAIIGGRLDFTDTVKLPVAKPITWSLLIDSFLTNLQFVKNTSIKVIVPGLLHTDLCVSTQATNPPTVMSTNDGNFVFTWLGLGLWGPGNWKYRCYRPSL